MTIRCFLMTSQYLLQATTFLHSLLFFDNNWEKNAVFLMTQLATSHTFTFWPSEIVQLNSYLSCLLMKPSFMPLFSLDVIISILFYPHFDVLSHTKYNSHITPELSDVSFLPVQKHLICKFSVLLPNSPTSSYILNQYITPRLLTSSISGYLHSHSLLVLENLP